MIDIREDKGLEKADINPETDPKVFLSRETGRGVLQPDWKEAVDPVMCSYKVVSVRLKIRGFQNRLQAFAHKVSLLQRWERNIIKQVFSSTEFFVELVCT